MKKGGLGVRTPPAPLCSTVIVVGGESNRRKLICDFKDLGVQYCVIDGGKGKQAGEEEIWNKYKSYMFLFNRNIMINSLLR